MPVEPGDLSMLPSHMTGDVLRLRATAKVGETLNSMIHGTERKMSRSKCMPLAKAFDFATLRRDILLTGCASLRTEGPYAYRDLDKRLALSN